MGKQIRFVLTQNKQKLLINKAIELAKKNNLVIIYENYILKDNAIPTDKFITLYLIERNDLEKVYPFLNYNQINDLIENSLEVTMNVSDDFELNDYSRLWIDNTQYFKNKTVLFGVYKEIVEFIKRESLGYNKEETDWMFFEETYMETYRRLKGKRT